MKPEDKRRVLASGAALLAMPFYFFCCETHYCIGGHMEHPPYPWYYLANEFGWLTFLVIAFVFAFRSNIPAKKAFIILTALMLTFLILGAGMLALVLAVGLTIVSIYGLGQGKTNRNLSNKACDASLEPVPDADSSARQG